VQDLVFKHKESIRPDPDFNADVMRLFRSINAASGKKPAGWNTEASTVNR